MNLPDFTLSKVGSNLCSNRQEQEEEQDNTGTILEDFEMIKVEDLQLTITGRTAQTSVKKSSFCIAKHLGLCSHCKP